MQEEFRPLNKEETALVYMLLSDDFEGAPVLRIQLKCCRVAQIDKNGSLTFRIPENHEKAAVKYRVPVEAEAADIDGVTIHVLLHVVNGHLHELEYYKDDSTAIRKAPSATDWKKLCIG